MENDKKLFRPSQSDEIPFSDCHELITTERSRKFDLLIHLITNLQQSLVLSGPEGIGKTTYLKKLQDQYSSVWQICYIKATVDLSFEQTQAQLQQSVDKAFPDEIIQTLTEGFAHFERNQKKLLLLINGAGELIPGLLSSLCQLAAVNPALGIVFALTPDEIHVKNSTDSAINACHFIDIPPLTEKQSGEFLQNLSVKPGAVISYKAISPALVEKIYRETHGIPGKIIEILPGISSMGVHESSYGKALFLIAGAVLMVCGIGYFLWNDLLQTETEQSASVISQEMTQFDIKPPVIERQAVDAVVTKKDIPEKSGLDLVSGSRKNSIVAEASLQEKGSDQSIDSQVAEMRGKPVTEKVIVSRQKKENTTDSVETAALNKNLTNVKEQSKKPDIPVKQASKIMKVPVKVKTDEIVNTFLGDVLGINGEEWILKQSAKKYTCQLIVLSSKKSVSKFTQKYERLKNKIGVFKSKKNDVELFTLIYGSFDSLTDARKARHGLPLELQQAWVRRFEPLQKQIKNNGY